MAQTRAAANGLRTNAACSMPVRARSPVNRPLPRSIRGSSLRAIAAPTHRPRCPSRSPCPAAGRPPAWRRCRARGPGRPAGSQPGSPRPARATPGWRRVSSGTRRCRACPTAARSGWRRARPWRASSLPWRAAPARTPVSTWTGSGPTPPSTTRADRQTPSADVHRHGGGDDREVALALRELGERRPRRGPREPDLGDHLVRFRGRGVEPLEELGGREDRAARPVPGARRSPRAAGPAGTTPRPGRRARCCPRTCRGPGSGSARSTAPTGGARRTRP